VEGKSKIVEHITGMMQNIRIFSLHYFANAVQNKCMLIFEVQLALLAVFFHINQIIHAF